MSNPWPFNGFPNAFAFTYIANASNVKTGTNPTYTEAMFLEDFEQFTNAGIPSSLMTQFISMADATVLKTRWHETWRYGMGLFIAHFSTLFMQSAAQGADSTPAEVVGAGQAVGVVASESVGDVSASYDLSAIVSSLEGWAAWDMTTYGIQYATLARMLGKGGMYVW